MNKGGLTFNSHNLSSDEKATCIYYNFMYYKARRRRIINDI